jgi:hypothetical protein
MAEALTPAQQRALLWLPADGSPAAYPLPKPISASVRQIHIIHPHLIELTLRRTARMVVLTSVQLTAAGMALQAALL